MMINIRKPFFTLLCCGILASCGKAPVGTPTVQPNLLMVTFDTLRADHLGAYGSGAGLTPNFDALAEKSVMFDNAYAVSSTTAPSHATIFSGLYPNEHGVLKNGVALSGDVTTVAEVLRDYGYSTAAFVSSYVLGELFDLDQGFDLYDEDFNFKRRRLGVLTVEAASKWISEQPNDKPWCVWVHFMDPHKPYRQPAEYLDPYITSALEGNDLDMASYNGAVAYMDSALPALLSSIDAQQADAGTLMAITADHGELFGEHGNFGHGTNLYQDVMRVPLIFNHSTLQSSRFTKDVGLIDFAPTVLDLLNIKLDVEVSGTSLLPFAGEGVATARPVFMQRRLFDEESIKPVFEKSGINVQGPQWSVIDSGYKLIMAPDAGEVELYHLAIDPDELTNLADAESEAIQLRRMQKLLSGLLDAQTLRASITDLSPEVLQNLEQLGYAK
jgi:arylsulfatase A-like enzyme